MTRRLLLLAPVLAACAADPSSPATTFSVRVLAVAPSAANVLAAVVTATMRDADSARVLFHVRGQSIDDATPTTAASDSMRIVVLGLRPRQAYVFRVVAYWGESEVSSDSVELITDTLPSDLPSYSASGSSPSPGFVAFAAGKYGLVIDNSGRVVWYHRFDPLGPGLNFMTTRNGRYVARPPAPAGVDAPWVEIDPGGVITRTFACARGLTPRFHDLIRQADDSYWLMCDETRTMDLSLYGGQPAAQVTGTEIQHLAADGRLLFRWSAFDHFAITDLAAADRAGQSVNWTHGNAIALDAAGHLLASFRSLNEVTSIDTTTGAIRWRLGGLRNEFGLTACCAPQFARQHGVRMTSSGRLVLLDNSGNPGDSRVERYLLDVDARTIQLEASLSASPPTVAALGGSVQDLPGGRMLAAFGDGRRVAEFTSDGAVAWKIDGDAGYVFRAQRIASLYAPGVGTAR